MSDHKGILFNLKHFHFTEKENVICLPITKTAVDNFIHYIKTLFAIINQCQSIDVVANNFLETFIEIYKTSFPKRIIFNQMQQNAIINNFLRYASEGFLFHGLSFSVTKFWRAIANCSCVCLLNDDTFFILVGSFLQNYLKVCHQNL